MHPVSRLTRCLVPVILSIMAPHTVAEKPVTRIALEQTQGETSVKTSLLMGNDFIAYLSENDRLEFLYSSETRDLWLLDHDNQLAQLINETIIQDIANRLAIEVSKFRSSLASLPEKERDLSMKRFEQLFESSRKQAAIPADNFIDQKQSGEFASIQCQWHIMITQDDSGDRQLGTACLVKPDVFENGHVLASFLSEVSRFLDIIDEADTGPISFPSAGSPIAFATHKGLLAIKVIPDPEFGIPQTAMEVVSVSTESDPNSQYQLPDDYRRQRFDQPL